MIPELRAWAYKRGFLKSIQLPGFVVSVGNISLGGTGKSPFVMELASWALGQKIPVAVLSRGYKRKSRKLWVIKPNETLPSSAELGDEPWMIKNRIPGVSLLVHRTRARMAARHWKELDSPKLVILDDGFQHWQARRDRDVVMVDAAESLDQKNLPFGRLREQAIALKRADLIIITRASSVKPEKLEVLRDRIAKLSKDPISAPWQAKKVDRTIPIISCDYEFDSFLDINTGKPVSLKAGHEFLIVSGIAKPEGLRNLVKTLSLPVKEEMYFSDHHNLSSKEEAQVQAAFRSLKNPAILITEKDWARWQYLNLTGYVVRVKFKWLGDSKSQLEQFFQEVKKCSM